MTHGNMTNFALAALFGTAAATCSSAQEDTRIQPLEPVVTVVAAQNQPRQLRVRAPRLRQGALPDALTEAPFYQREDGPRLGVMVDTEKDGLTVTEVSPDSLAESAGVAEGDIVYRIGEDRIETVGDVARALRSWQPGDAVPLTVIRAGEGLVELSGTLPEPPEHEDAPLADGHRGGFLGVEVHESDDDAAGVAVAGTIPNSAAWFAGLADGDRLLSIDGNAVDSYEALTGAVASKKPGTMVELVYQREGTEHTTSVRLGQRAPQGPMSMLGMPMDPRMRLHGPDGMEMFFGGNDQNLFRMLPGMDGMHDFEVRIERDGDGPQVLHFGGNGPMQGLHELLQPFDGQSRKVEVNIQDGEGTATIETENGTRTFILKDGRWVKTEDEPAPRES